MLVARISSIALLVGLTLSCAAASGRRALEDGRYADAIESLEVAAQRRPGSEKIAARLQEARRGWVGEELAALEGLRRQGRHAEATVALEALLSRSAGWSLSTELERGVSQQIAASAEQDHAQVLRLLRDHGPLTAERALPGVRALMDRAAYRVVRDETVALLRHQGAQRCETLGQEAADAPYFAWLLSFYCGHYGAPMAGSLPRPDACAGVTFELAVRGGTDAEAEAMRQAIARAYELGPFHDPRAKCRHLAAVSGRRADETSVSNVHLSAEWVEQVPYQATETEQVPHQVPYTDTEYYTEQEPFVRNETYTYSCGTDGQTCTGTRSVTDYRSVSKTRTVTKYRTEYRTETRTVTKYRSESRVFDYEARQHAYVYDASGAVELRAPLGLQTAVPWEHQKRFTDIEHDVSFPPAGVHPRRAELPTRAEVFAVELQTLASRLRIAMDQAYQARHCSEGAFDADRAAACLLARPPALPPEAARALQAKTGEQVDALQALLPSNPFVVRR